MTTHYSWGQSPDRLIPWAKSTASALTKTYGPVRSETEKRIPTLVYRGMSGTAHATALMLALRQEGWDRVPMAYIRKPEEKSHGIDVEHNLNHISRYELVLVPILVDDMVATGSTWRCILAGLLRNHWRLNLQPGDWRATQEPRVMSRGELEALHRTFNHPDNEGAPWWIADPYIRSHFTIS